MLGIRKFSHSAFADGKKKDEALHREHGVCRQQGDSEKWRKPKKQGNRVELLAAEDEPEELGVEEENGGSDDPGNHDGEAGVGKLAHFVAVTGELNQRNNGER